MKKVLMMWMMFVGTIMLAQNKIDEVRMQRDIEVAENILGTLIKQQYGKRQFFPMEVRGSYLPGYGVTFHVPSEMFGNMFFMQSDDNVWGITAPGEPMPPGVSYSYSYSTSSDEGNAEEQAQKAKSEADRNYQIAKRTSPRAKNSKHKVNTDSAAISYHEKILEAAKNFITDYGDLLTQLQPNEKIVVTNKGEGNNFPKIWMSGSFEHPQKQNLVNVEGTKSDVNQFRQGKITRDQLLAKLKIVNSEISDELQPDLELLSSILNRLYSRDLSKTFFSDDNIYYERLKDFGALYHMQVYASNQIDGFNEDLYDMPTVRLHEVDQETRDKKVKELYPEFEKSIKEDMLEYGRTIKSLKDDETLMIEINLTRCRHCAIPSTLELSIKYSALKDYSTGKITKDAALAKITVKKGPNQ